jgi:hypothetical protein
MSGLGGIMSKAIGALGAAEAADLVLKTDVVSRVIDDATKRTKETADFFEEIGEGIEEDEDDLPVQ